MFSDPVLSQFDIPLTPSRSCFFVPTMFMFHLNLQYPHSTKSHKHLSPLEHLNHSEFHSSAYFYSSSPEELPLDFSQHLCQCQFFLSGNLLVQCQFLHALVFLLGPWSYFEIPFVPSYFFSYALRIAPLPHPGPPEHQPLSQGKQQWPHPQPLWRNRLERKGSLAHRLKANVGSLKNDKEATGINVRKKTSLTNDTSSQTGHGYERGPSGSFKDCSHAHDLGRLIPSRGLALGSRVPFLLAINVDSIVTIFILIVSRRTFNESKVGKLLNFLSRILLPILTSPFRRLYWSPLAFFTAWIFWGAGGRFLKLSNLMIKILRLWTWLSFEFFHVTMFLYHPLI